MNSSELLRKWMHPSVFLLLVLFSAITIWIRLSSVDATYAVNQSALTIKTLEKEKADLLKDLAVLKSPKRLEALARDRLNMRRPEGAEIVRIDSVSE